jgi:hypothetical protein
LAVGVGLVLLASPGPHTVQAQPLAQAEATLKARLTLSLTRFTQWPATASGEALRLCVAHRDPFTAQAFAETDGQIVNGRRIQVVRAPPLAGCHVLYIDGTAERVPDLIRSAAALPVLVVGDAEGMLAQGAMVEFVPVNDSIRFDVNMPAVRQGQLAISSQALKLARQVRE